MGDIIPFSDNIQLPAYLQKARKTNFAAFHQGVSAGFPVLSINGKVFTLVRGGERRMIPDKNDPDEPARALNIIIVGVNPNLSKVYYAKGYEPGAADKPDCYSNDSVRPAADAADRQSQTCAGCRHNEWGSGQNGKGKACADSRRLAVVPAKDVGDPMLLRVPPASLKTLSEYAAFIERRGVPIETVITTLRFDPEEATPKLMWKPLGLVSEELYQKITSTMDSEVVRQILGVAEGSPSAATPPVSEIISDADVSEALKAAAAAPSVADEDEGEEEEEEAPKPKATPKPKVKAAPKPKPEPVNEDDAEPDSLVAAMAGILDEYDD